MHIVTAFAVLLRRILCETCDSDEVWLRKLASTGFTPDDIRLVVDVVSDRSWMASSLESDDGRQCAFSVLRNLYPRTWFSQDHVSGAVHTTLGSMAGSPPAGIVSALAFLVFCLNLMMPLSAKAFALFCRPTTALFLI